MKKIKYQTHLSFGFWRLTLRNRSGQSLIEIVIGLGIGAILIGAGAFTIAAMLRSNLSTEKYQAASAFSQELVDSVRSYAGAGWQNLYGLAKGSGTTYFLNATGTTYLVVNGQEGMLDNDVTNGLVGEWKFDEDATSTSTTTYDTTGNNRDGTLVNNPTRASSTCKIANCLSFDGASQSVAIPVLNSQSVTVSAWFNRTSQDATNADAIFGGWYWNADSQLRQGFDLRFYINDPRLNWVVVTTDGSTVTNKSVYSSNLSTSTLYHAVGTYDSASGISKIYVNGVLINQSTANAGNTIVPQTQYPDMRIGYSRVNNGYFPGYIDDVRIYNRALSDAEVERLYNSGTYKRFFAIENVCRTTGASSTISGTAPCGGGTAEDGSTQQVTVHTQWTVGAGTGEAKITGFLTRAQNAVFQQTDWSGGSGDTGSHAAAPTTYGSGTNVSATAGSIQIQTLTQQ